MVGVVNFVDDKHLDFHDMTLEFLKYNIALEILSKVVLHHGKSSFDQ